jgi:dihydrofolate synthase/folylpolyglutamate synthase
MPFATESEAITYVFRSMRKLRGQQRGYDDVTRNLAPTRRLLMAVGLLDQSREYAIVTGSKGKGSTTIITAKLLQHLGHTVGTITSPHLVSWRERIRVNGRAIPEPDLLRILGEYEAEIDAIEASLPDHTYFSPQGIFLAVALRWFDEQGVNAAVLEVGRGGRYDDISVAPNKLSLFTPIMLEHPDYMGPTIERIAWHKAGIIKAYSTAYSLPQQPSVMDVLQAESDLLGADFNWIAPKDIGLYLGAAPEGQRVDIGRYGEITLSLLGRYQIANATLAMMGAGNVHGRLRGVLHGTPEYAACIRAGLSSVVWPGRCQKLQSAPAVYVDGAINAESAALLVESLREHLQQPVITVIGVPDDKDYRGVYESLAPISNSLILTETSRNPSLHFLPQDEALAAARSYHPQVSYSPNLPEAAERAKTLAGTGGTVLIVGTQSIVAETIVHWGQTYEQI